MGAFQAVFIGLYLVSPLQKCVEKQSRRQIFRLKLKKIRKFTQRILELRQKRSVSNFEYWCE
jgi:hypothetical protein